MRYVKISNFAILAALLAMGTIARGDDSNREYQLKSAFIYNFAQFTEWPDKAFTSSDAPFVCAVIGPNPFGDALANAMAGKKIDDHPIIVKQLNSVDDIPGCHLLFVPAAEDDSLADIFKAVGDHPILTVGETDKFLPAGGTIRFLIEDNKIRFEVNLDSAAKAGLKISSKLLSLAKIYKQQGS